MSPLLSQLLFNGLIVGCTNALLGIGFNLFFLGQGFFNLGFGAVHLISIYLFVVALQYPALGLVAKLFFAVAGGIIMAVSQELVLYKPLRYSSASLGIMLLSSFGVLIIVQNSISIFFGDQSMTMQGPQLELGFRMINLQVMPVQIATVIVGSIIAFIIWAFLRYSWRGKQIRALASDLELANIIGVDIEKTRLLSIILGAVAVSVSAILVSYEIGVSPRIGFDATMIGLVTMIIGGIGHIVGSILAGLFIGIIQQLAIGYLPGQWQDTILFFILLLFLLARPHGFHGKLLRKNKA